MFIGMSDCTRQTTKSAVEPGKRDARMGTKTETGMRINEGFGCMGAVCGRRAVPGGLRSSSRSTGSERPSPYPLGAALQGPTEGVETPAELADRRRRYAQLQHAEARLRPLQTTKLAEVYWRVQAELFRLGRELLEEQEREVGGTRIDRH